MGQMPVLTATFLALTMMNTGFGRGMSVGELEPTELSEQHEP